MVTKKEVWKSWVDEYIDISDPVPLFESNSNGRVQTKEYGKNDRRVLERSSKMTEEMRSEGRKVVDDYHGDDDTYEGLIYMMYKLRDDDLIPLYIGKAGKYGRDGERLSANLRNFEEGKSSTAKFARWGDGYDYHIGDLSAVVLGHEARSKGKYEGWQEELFADGRSLHDSVNFWVKAWKYDDVGLYYDFVVSLEHLEYQLIGMASDLYPERLLNREGR